MSSGNEDRRSLDKSSENFDVLLKKNISYSRDFLLSFSNLDICKKLPSGFDESALSEIVDASENIPEQPRNPGILPLHGLRRNEYSSSPPNSGDSNNHSKGTYGKWENRSSGCSGRDSYSQFDKDSDSVRWYASQSRRSWHSTEHDGLLGSGSSRLSSHAGGISQKIQTSEKYQHSSSNEAYHPPRPYKGQALPHIQRDTDSYNDETFGSSDSTSRDKSKEEMRRRASFEMMRKEQLKVLQEKQQISERQKAGGASKLSEVLLDGKEEKGIFGNRQLATSISNNHLEKSSFASSPPVRPLVPPGFRNNVLEKGSILKSLASPPLLEVVEPETGDSLLRTGLFNGQHATLYSPKVLDRNGEILEEKALNGSKQSYSVSLVENTFVSTKLVNDRGSNSAEHGGNSNKTWSPSSVNSAKFAQGFSEEDAKVPDDSTQGKQNDLLSSIVGGDTAGGPVFDTETTGVNIRDKERTIPGALMCEALERSILSEYGQKSENLSSASANPKKPKSHVDTNAALHLLSMLQKGRDEAKTAPDSGFGINLVDNTLVISQEHDTETTVYGSKGKRKSKNNPPNSGNTATLESLFGNTFMNELQLVEAPVSIQVDKSGFWRQHNGLQGVHEQENLIPVNDPHQMTFRPIGNLFSSTPIDTARKLATRGSAINNEQDMPYRSVQVQRSSPSHHNLDSQLKFLNQDLMPCYDSHANSPNVTRHPLHHLNVGPADYDVPLDRSMQMNIPNIHTHMTPNLKTVLQHGNKGNELVQQMNQMQGFHSEARLSRAGSYGVPTSGTNVYSDGAFQRLMDLELHAKEIHPGTYGRQVKHGFQFR